jgi:hypothetical protein
MSRIARAAFVRPPNGVTRHSSSIISIIFGFRFDKSRFRLDKSSRYCDARAQHAADR